MLIRAQSIKPYVSLPFYKSHPEYTAAVNEYAQLGFQIFKFHVWGQIEKDRQLIELLQNKYRDMPYRFMCFEGAYDVAEFQSLCTGLEKHLFVWLEASIDDSLLDQYRELRRWLPIPIIPAGYDLYSTEFIKHGIASKSWGAG